ncbi:GGDEF domain-containing protein [Rhodococcus sp. H36-A4]|uniref:GGDEF domain-containing protein n=1 Tax=Rhodococcus sp. H36-A4 TaxID=3004353 RepID=UPI0022B06294|nr:GGDEF domain-containing protein [Rhodococcus sp. H36-A4]MCZ4077172.1 GGDEF domain-containing protein [Rhodococcus sp. H36-A4]
MSAYRIGIGFNCIFFGIAGLTAFLTAVPPSSMISKAVLVSAVISSFVVGALWVRGPWPSERISTLFVVYADIGTTMALLSFGSLQMSFPICVLLAATGLYVQVFHSPKLLMAHLLWSAVTVAGMFLLILASPNLDHGLAWSHLIMLLPVMFTTPVFLQSILLNLRVDADDAMLDPLTGLHNRRGLDEAIPRFLRGGREVSVLVIDVDRFKSINDRFGHEGGDLALTLIARRLRVDEVLVARTGGEEFAVVTTVSAEQAISVAEWMRTRLHSLQDICPLTVSVGVAHSASVDGDGVCTVTDLLRQADGAMYEAKRRGGNQVVVADPVAAYPPLRVGRTGD